ncbi:MAG TPA: glycoside hydrolase family 32 protein [Edaphobacter sp.]|nr:glycoside hydrolase family 32 protein [Edaphobacter sp.]
MDRRKFLMSSALVALHSGASSASEILATDAGQPSATLQNKLESDRLRPQYHLLPQAGFVGDPCAPRYYKGKYHVFFHGSFGGRGWQHAMSDDLVHWTHMPVALSPTDGGYDSYGTFTGGVLPGGEEASIIYTGVTKVPRDQETIRAEGLREVQCIATSTDDDLRTWKKRLKPVIISPPAGVQVTGFRDPMSWKDGETWYMAVGSGFPQKGGTVLLYRSKDTETWEYLHPLAQGTWNGQSFSNPVPNGEMWECPDFFALGDKHVLLYSTEHTTFWEVGTLDKRSLLFHSERKGLLDHGNYYAPRSMADGQNRRILWGWVQETRDRALAKEIGWFGSISLPRVLTIAPDNSLETRVAAELEGLRQNTVELKNPRKDEELSSFLSHALITKRAGEIICVFDTTSGDCGITLQLRAKDGLIAMLNVEYSKANGRPFVAIGDRLLPLNPDRDGNSKLHFWIDGSIFETFIDDRQVMTTRSYAAPAEEGEISVAWNGSARSLRSLQISEIRSISTDRLTI